jgi:hypothetical protein
MKRHEAVARFTQLSDGYDGMMTAYADLCGNPRWAEHFRMIPYRMHGGLVRWVLFGIVPGDFLQAIIRGDLFDAAGRADDENQRLLYEYAYVLHNGVPSDSKGPNAFKTWKGMYPDEPEPEPQQAA